MQRELSTQTVALARLTRRSATDVSKRIFCISPARSDCPQAPCAASGAGRWSPRQAVQPRIRAGREGRRRAHEASGRGVTPPLHALACRLGRLAMRAALVLAQQHSRSGSATTAHQRRRAGKARSPAKTWTLRMRRCEQRTREPRAPLQEQARWQAQGRRPRASPTRVPPPTPPATAEPPWPECPARRPRQSLRSTPHQATAATGTHERVRLQRMLDSSRGTAVRLCTGGARAALHGAAEPAGPQGAPSAGTPAGNCRACAGCVGSPAAACATSCCKTCSCATAACRTACTQHSRHALSHARPHPRCLRDTNNWCYCAIIAPTEHAHPGACMSHLLSKQVVEAQAAQLRTGSCACWRRHGLRVRARSGRGRGRGRWRGRRLCGLYALRGTSRGRGGPGRQQSPYAPVQVNRQTRRRAGLGQLSQDALQQPTVTPRLPCGQGG